MERSFKRNATIVALALMLVQSHVFTRTASGVITGRVTDLQGQSHVR